MPDLLDMIWDALADGIKLLPFLFLTYAAMEYMEHKLGAKTKGAIEKAGHFGPVFGAVCGAFPQCGFSAAASNLYAGSFITVGTLIAIYLSTSDEMLPILISEQAGMGVIAKLLGIKVLIGMLAGFAVDFFIRRRQKALQRDGGEKCVSMYHVEETGHGKNGTAGGSVHCHCGSGILKAAAVHTMQIFLFLLIVSFALNLAIGMAGEDFLADVILNRPVVGHLAAGLVGLIPNCAASVIITQLYLEGWMGLGVMMTGLLVGSGVGLLVLFRVNGSRRESIKITLLLYIIGVVSGMLLDMAGFCL